MTLGTTLEALIDLSARLNPKDPPNAFAHLWFRVLDAEDLEVEASNPIAPPEVRLFAWTGGDGNCFGFLMDDPAQPTDERPIVKIYGCADASAYEVVAANLRDLLSLLALAFGEVITRAATDQEWQRFRKDWYGDDPKTLRQMERLSRELLTLPGVRIPSSPSTLACAAPTRAFSARR